MSKKGKHSNKALHNPVAVAEPIAEATEPTADSLSPVAEVADTLSALLEQLPEDLRAIVANYRGIKDPELKKKAEANFAKLMATEQQANDAKTWGSFNKEAEQELRKLLADLQTKHGVSLLGRKVVVSFSEVANPIYTHTIMGKASSSGGNGGRKGGGFTSHGKVNHEGGEYNSLHALCVSKNWKYEGRRTAWEAVEKPQDMEGKALGFTNKIEKTDGKLIVTKES